jgi:hypothetical protein
MQNEDVEDSNAQSLPPDNIHHSGKYQNSSSWHRMPPNAGDDAIGNGPGPRVSGLHDFFPSTRLSLKKSEQKAHRLRKETKLALKLSSFRYI